MENFVKHFIRASLVWLGVGVLLGVSMVLFPAQAVVCRGARMHANPLGCGSRMIFGVAYRVLPRFAGHPLYSRRAAALHVVAANAGLALMVAGWIVRVHAADVGAVMLPAGALASAAGAFLFIANIWRTLSGAPATSRLEAARAVR